MDKLGPRWNVTVRREASKPKPKKPTIPALAPALDLAECMTTLMHRDDGWLRAVPQDHGKLCFYKWKFTRGPWEGYYVMWRDDDEDPLSSLRGLILRITQVYAGDHSPVLDRAYS